MPEPVEVYVLGAGGHAKVVVATLLAAGYMVAGLLDDDESTHGAEVLSAPVLGPVGLLHSLGKPQAIIGIGNNRIRNELATRFSGLAEWVTVVHPRADVHPDAQLGAGTVVFCGAVVQPGTVIGNHVIVNTGATVDHDCSLADFVHVAPGVHLAGNVRLQEGVFMGIASAAVPGVTVGAWTTVGAGGAVTVDLPAGVTAVGVPARV